MVVVVVEKGKSSTYTQAPSVLNAAAPGYDIYTHLFYFLFPFFRRGL